MELRERLEKLPTDVAMLITQWAARQAMGEEQDALATVVVRFLRKEIRALLAPREEEPGLREALSRLVDAAGVYGADQSGAEDSRCGLVQPISVKEGNELNDAIVQALSALAARPVEAKPGECQVCHEPANLTLCYECADARVENTIKARGLTPQPVAGDQSGYLHDPGDTVGEVMDELKRSFGTCIDHYAEDVARRILGRIIHPVAGDVRERVAQEIEFWLVDGNDTYIPAKPDDDTYTLTDRILALLRPEPGLAEAQKAIHRIVIERDRVREVTLPSKLNTAIEMAAKLMGDTIAAPRDESKEGRR